MNKSGDGDIKERAFLFAVRVVKMSRVIKRDYIDKVLVTQLIRSGTSIGANIEEAVGAYTKNDFTHSMNVAKKETRETFYWLRLIRETCDIKLQDRMNGIINECEEILKILTKIVKTAKLNSR